MTKRRLKEKRNIELVGVDINEEEYYADIEKNKETLNQILKNNQRRFKPKEIELTVEDIVKTFFECSNGQLPDYNISTMFSQYNQYLNYWIRNNEFGPTYGNENLNKCRDLFETFLAKYEEIISDGKEEIESKSSSERNNERTV